MPFNKELVINVAQSIRDILDDHPAGPSIFREILQNTDDAGGRVQRFILDTREHSSEGLFDPILKDCQGPAIIACNDSKFQEQDWQAICSISNSSKKGDEKSTGKSGLGFCTTYHVTDYPHVLSGDQLIILDPHKNIKSSTGCIGFSTRRSPSETDRDTYPAHFEAFGGILKPEDDVFDGTAIRLPLRLPNSRSRINPTPMSVEAAREIFDIFVKEALPEVMLFLKHITAIEVIEISPDGKETLWAAARIENAEEIVRERSKTRGRSTGVERSHYKLKLTETYTSGYESNVKTRDWIITHYVDSFRISTSAMAKRLNRIDDLKGVEEDMISDKLFPHVALAFPLLDKTTVPKPGFSGSFPEPSFSGSFPEPSFSPSFPEPSFSPSFSPSLSFPRPRFSGSFPKPSFSEPSFSGRLFTLLPLPILTHFPLHIHATLALASSHQNLRNAQENVTDPRSRLRVEWNRIIFSRFVPEAWVALMKHLVSNPQGIDVFDTWPNAASIRNDGHGYWPSLPHLLLKEAAVRYVWPLRSDPSSHKQLTDVLVTPRIGRKAELLAALESCNVPIVAIPSNVLETIFTSAEFRDRILGPAAAVSFLRGNSKKLSQLEKTAIKMICDYLVEANDINLIFKLPIIPNVAGGHTSISPDATYILAKGPDAKVFQPVAPDLLAADAMSPETLQLLLEKSNGKVHYLGSKEVAMYLKKRVGPYGGPRIPTVCTGVNASVSEWLIGFWAWMDKWDKFDALVADEELWDAVQALHALPLHTPNKRPALRQVKGSAIHPAQTDGDVLSALVSLEVPVLLNSIEAGRSIGMVSKKPTDVEFILQNLPKTTKSFQSLTQSSRKVLHDFLSDQLSHLIASSRSKSASVLDSTCQNALRTLPIFPLLHPGERSAESLSFDVAPEGFRFVSKSVHVIPNIKGIAFFDFEQGMSLCRALGAEAIDEITVLEMSIEPEAWRHLHPRFILPNIISRLIHHLSDFKDATRQKISELEIVDVGRSGKRKSPKSVIDPLSPLAGLFDPEDEILPVGEFAKEGQGSHLQHLRNLHMMQTALTDQILEERIDYIVTTSEGSDPDMAAKKALCLLSLLDKRSREHSLTDMSPHLVDLLCQKAWIPAGGEFYQSSDCWDSRAVDTLLCDWVLPRAPIEVSSSSLRTCLGWDVVPFDVLRRQMLALMDACPECQVSAAEDISDRIKAVLRTLASRLGDGTCSQDELESLADELGDAEWVPISEGRRIKAQRSWLPSDQLERDLGSRFFPVAASLMKEEGIRGLLTCMRLPERPSTADLYSGQLEISEELSQLDLESRLREDLIRASIDLALEICRGRDPSEVRQLPLLVPTESGTLVDAENALYNDMDLEPQRIQDGIQFTHPLMSQADAKTLRLRTYRERQLNQLESTDDKDGFYIGEDTTTRIKGVFLDYDIDHSINEWAANAADPGASVPKLLVDAEQPLREEPPNARLATSSLQHDNVSLAQELACIENTSTPSTKHIVDLILALGRAVPSAIRNKHQLYRLIIKCRDLCNYLHLMPRTGDESKSGSDILERCWEMIDGLERILLELTEIVSEAMMPFGVSSLATWNNSCARLSRIHEVTVSLSITCGIKDSGHAKQDRYFDDCSWSSLLLHQGIEVPVENMHLEGESISIEPQYVVHRLNYLVNEMKHDSNMAEDTRELLIKILSDTATITMKSGGLGSASLDFWGAVAGALKAISLENRLNQETLSALRGSWGDIANLQILPPPPSTSPTPATSQNPIRISLPEELTRLYHEATPATEPLVLLLQSLGRGAPTVTRNKHKIYAILARACDICNHILAVGARPELSGLETLDEYYNLIETLEGVLLNAAKVLPVERIAFGPEICVSWSEGREKLCEILNELYKPPFSFDLSSPEQELAKNVVFDDFYWISLLHEGIEQELDRQYSDTAMPPVVASVREGLWYLENEIKCRYQDVRFSLFDPLEITSLA